MIILRDALASLPPAVIGRLLRESLCQHLKNVTRDLTRPSCEILHFSRETKTCEVILGIHLPLSS